MKTLFVVLLLVAGQTLVNAQDIPQSEVPSVVLNAFQQKFSGAEDIEWENKGGLYKAEFEVGSRDHEVSIDKTGKIIRHKEDFPKKQLPQAIQQQLATEFKAYKLDDADRIEIDGKIFYEVDLDGASGDREVLFTEDGKVQENKAN